MSHVREGEIHAYLDGALDRLGETRASEIRRHVDGCDDCRARLEEERRVRDVAVQLLDSGAPGSIEMPPFEEILRRAEAGPTGSSVEGGPEPVRAVADAESAARRSLGRTERWAWAASLVVALGTGWLLRGSELVQAGRSAPDNATIAMEAQSRPAGPVELDLGSADVRSEGAGARMVDAVSEPVGAGSEAERFELAPEAIEAPPRSVPIQEEARQRRATEPVATASLEQAAAGARRIRDQLAEVALADSALNPDDRRPTEERAAADEFVELDQPAREAVAAAPTLGYADAAIRPNENVGVDLAAVALAPGLAVIEMSGDSSGHVRVVQLFPEGDTLVLEFEGVEGAYGLLGGESSVALNAPADVLAAQTSGAVLRRADEDAPVSLDERFVSEVRIRRGSGLLVVRSRRPQAELEALLRSWGMLSS